jgi:hypothetical protein
MRKEQQWCVSIYMPTHRTGVETQQDPIRLKNLLGKAEKELSDRGMGRRDVQKMLEPPASYCRILISGSIRVTVWRFFSLPTEFATIDSR